MSIAAHDAFGIREVCHCVFTSKKDGSQFVIDTAKMSSIESSSTTVYAQGGSGNSRLIGWEGEKNVTFTIEDAILTPESFKALTGATGGLNEFKVYPTSFAGYYEITAFTLVRAQADGKDYLATITIPNAKLQTQLNLSMSPTGDPSTFTFTFDAFPSKNDNDKNLLFKFEIENTAFSGDLSDNTNIDSNITTVYIEGIPYTTTDSNPILGFQANSLSGTPETGYVAFIQVWFGDYYQTVLIDNKKMEIANLDNAVITDLQKCYILGDSSSTTINLTKGSTTKWYII